MSDSRDSLEAVYKLIPGFEGLRPPKETRFRLALSKRGRFATERHLPQQVVINNLIILFRLADWHRKIRGHRKFSRVLAADWSYALGVRSPFQPVMMKYMCVFPACCWLFVDSPD